MTRRYGVARLQWLCDASSSANLTVTGCLLKPAAFQDDDSGNWWTLAVALDCPVDPGDTVLVAVTPMIEENALELMQLGRVFELKEGPCTLAIGEVVQVGTLEVSPEETPSEALQRALRAEQPELSAGFPR